MPAGLNIRLKRATAAVWTAQNPILQSGELGLETDTRRLKVGDGTATWTALVYINVSPVIGVQMLAPAGLYAPNLTTVAAPAANASIYEYLGKAQGTPPLAEVVYRVTTAYAAGAVAGPWAEIGIFRGAPVANGAGGLTRVGFADVAAVVNTVGIKKTNVTLTGVVPGDDLWVAFGSNAATPAQFRGLLADDLQTGNVRLATATRPSTLAAGGTPALASATQVPVWCSVRV